ncbi:hypothetical protein K2P47_02815 [Patescibacteria group bacterium]|nr:hypothetical protein [Patescibacteria group bacterium]
MKLIIIIQTLIIIAGAYYVYLLSNPKEVIVEPVPEASVPVIESDSVREGYTPPTVNPPADPATLNSEVTGHSDVGMEYPIPDEEIQVR